MNYRTATTWLVPLLVILLRIASPTTANASYFLVAIYALLGRRQAVLALAISWLLSTISPGIAADCSWASIGRHLVLGSAAFSVLLRSNMVSRLAKINHLVLATLLLGGFIIVHSLLFSPIKDVSILKAVSWTTAMATLISAWSGLDLDERAATSNQIMALLLVILVLSLPLLLLPQGYLRNGTGFQGLLNHPQAFGLTMGVLLAWSGGIMLGSRRPSWFIIAICFASAALVFLSESRTAGLAAIFGLSIAPVTGRVLGRTSILALMPGLASRRVHVVLAFAMSSVLLAGSALSTRVSDFLSKGGRADATNLIEAYDDSRGRLLSDMLDNVHSHPWQGIGFGIASNPYAMVVDRDPVLGLPTGASIEKGIMPVAVLEELGILGAVAVFFWLWVLIRRAAIGGGIVALSVFSTVLAMNVGENVLFSAGGMGLLLLIVVAWAATSKPSLNRISRNNG